MQIVVVKNKQINLYLPLKTFIAGVGTQERGGLLCRMTVTITKIISVVSSVESFFLYNFNEEPIQ